jgi:sugar/nucleoside kinase (ribokinase family)
LPEVSLDIRHKFLTLATEANNFRVASFARGEIVAARERGLFSLVDLIAVNIEEASQIVGYPYDPGDRTRFLADCSHILTAAQPNIQIVVSAGPEGAFAFDTGSWTRYLAPQLPVVSTAGAGDALLAGIICGQSLGLPLTYPHPFAQMPSGVEIRSAVELGLLLASFSVTSSHTINFDANPDSLSRFALSLVAQGEPSRS